VESWSHRPTTSNISVGEELTQKPLANFIQVSPLQELRVDPELAALIPPLAHTERQGLEATLKMKGCREPLVVWEEEDIR
jgi:hypothetical protein